MAEPQQANTWKYLNQTNGEWIQTKHILVRHFECKVEEKATLSTQNCQFPFILNGKTFNNCTDHSEPNAHCLDLVQNDL